jgi:hypothetical protein
MRSVRRCPSGLSVTTECCVQHYPMDDYREFERVMMRVTVSGDRPF